MTCGHVRFTPTLLQPNTEWPHAAGARPLKGAPGDQQHHSHRAAEERLRVVTTTEILAVIGGAALVLTAAARVPAALAEFLRACVLVTTAVRELRAALTKHGDRPGAGDSNA